ncbi:GNAT family N-acetyltransferase [Histidinibacterium aquaticum]|uniref:N-acetyltransferase n=1 Tax=Histidinibacterium aquaticum TaxID=2613962 RepID=A0A5J5GR70_9RHOB|nr:GNAT family N-acetyltransferase [Histidinibacterium aquaticum]KAA9010567.1 N-acetyltransferase [Histidinibacterium aquaticum]
MRRAGQSDLPGIRRLLEAHVERTMFPLSNLLRHGLDGPAEYAPSFWVAGRQGVTDALALNRNGSVNPCLPSQDWAAAARALSGAAVSAVIGPADESRPLIERLGLAGRPTMLDRDDPHFAMKLQDLAVPDGPGELIPLAEADRETMLRWRIAYEVEALGLSPESAERTGADSLAKILEAGSHRVLVDDGRPLAMTGFNSALPEIVQIGGVYTPPKLRGEGHARRAVALHLAEARAAGATRATLFAAGEAGVRAYTAIGFRRIGAFTLFLLKDRVHV